MTINVDPCNIAQKIEMKVPCGYEMSTSLISRFVPFLFTFYLLVAYENTSQSSEDYYCFSAYTVPVNKT